MVNQTIKTLSFIGDPKDKDLIDEAKRAKDNLYLFVETAIRNPNLSS